MHMNIEGEDSTRMSRCLHKLGWAALALFAPEFVLWRALMQLLEARELRNAVNEILGERHRNNNPVDGATGTGDGKMEEWSLAHGFFGVMGGFTLPVSIMDEISARPFGKILTPWGIMAMARRGQLPEIGQKKIEVKSKADQLAKLIACLQVGWMVVQAIAREVQGLPVTLIELNTIAHVICAFVMYGLWWKKPQDVKEPLEIALDTPTITVLSRPRFFFQFGHEADWERRNAVSTTSTEQQPSDPQVEQYTNNESRDAGERASETVDETFDNSITRPAKPNVISRPPPNTTIYLEHGNKLEGTPFIARKDVTLTAQDIDNLDQGASLQPSLFEVLLFPRGQFTEKVSNIESIGSLCDEGDLFTLVLFALLGLVYGGIHARSWNSHFPTIVEQIMWRIAVCVVGGGGFPIILVWLLAKRVGMSRCHLLIFEGLLMS